MIKKIGIVLVLLLAMLFFVSTDVKAENRERSELGTEAVIGATATVKNVCNHVYEYKYGHSHNKNRDNSCRVERYELQCCKSCGYVANKVLIKTYSFKKCIH